MNKHLKTKNLPIIGLFIVWCCAIYAVIFSESGISWTSLETKFSNLNQQDSLVILIMPILILILSGIIKPQFKEILVFWRFKHPLPGCKAFSGLAFSDPRINMEILRQKIPDIPHEPNNQNAAWYKLFKKYEHRVTVFIPHKNFLLSRDLSIIALLFMLGGMMGLIISGSTLKSLILYFFILASQYVLLSIVAQNHGNRLVCNVIAEFISEG